MTAHSFYTVTPTDLSKVASAEHATLKEAEAAVRQRTAPEDLCIVEVVRVLSGFAVPERVRWVSAATRTREGRKRGKAPKAEK